MRYNAANSIAIRGKCGKSRSTAAIPSNSPKARLTSSIQRPARGSNAPAPAPTISSGAPIPRVIRNSAAPPNATLPVCAIKARMPNNGDHPGILQPQAKAVAGQRGRNSQRGIDGRHAQYIGQRQAQSAPAVQCRAFACNKRGKDGDHRQRTRQQTECDADEYKKGKRNESAALFEQCLNIVQAIEPGQAAGGLNLRLNRR